MHATDQPLTPMPPRDDAPLLQRLAFYCSPLAVKHFGSRMTLLEALVNHRIWDQPSPKTS